MGSVRTVLFFSISLHLSVLLSATSIPCNSKDGELAGECLESSSMSLLQAKIEMVQTHGIDFQPMQGNGIVMMMNRWGCSGSTYVFQVLFKLLHQHGIVVWSPEKEFLFDKTSPWNISTQVYCTEHDGTQHYWPRKALARVQAAWSVLSGTKSCREVNVSKPTILFFDGHVEKLMSAVLPFLGTLGTQHVKLFGTHRENRLEQMVCEVRDCFTEGPSDYPVSPDGTPRFDLCFDRRKEKFTENDYQVHFNPDRLKHSLDVRSPVSSSLRGSLTENGFKDYPVASTEALTEFEYDGSEEAVDRSANLYATILRGIGIKPDMAIVRAQLDEEGRGGRKRHDMSKAIYNFAEVQNALRGTPYEI